MVYKWRISRPAFQANLRGVEVMHPGIEVEFETGSIDEAHGIYMDKGTELGAMFGGDVLGSAIETATQIEAPGTNTLVSGEGGPAVVETDKERKARERKEKKNAADPSTANAPAPIVIPGAEVPPTAPVTADDGIPDALRRAPATVAPPPPPAPPAPPAAPPTGVIAGKVIAELEKRAAGSADGGQALADWLGTSGITVKGATLPEAVVVIRLQGDEKLTGIAAALGVA